jgi:hypothetical protein
LSLESVTIVSFDAAFDKVNPQIDCPPEVNIAGVHTNDVNVAGAFSEIAAVRCIPFSVAVTVADPSTASAPVDAANVAVIWPLNTIVETGTARLGLSLASATIVFPDAALDNVTVQSAVPPADNVFGVHPSEVSAAGAFSAIVAVRETPLHDAVTVAELSTASVPANAVNTAAV